MRWALRFLGFATLLAIPCYFLSHAWQGVLGRIAEAVVSRFGIQIEMSQVEIMAPFEIGIYVAMCLAGRHAPAPARRRALEWGVPILVLLEIVTVSSAVLLFFLFSGRGEASPTGIRLMTAVIEFVPWASATTVWLWLLGAWELPFGNSVPSRAPGAGRGSAPPPPSSRTSR